MSRTNGWRWLLGLVILAIFVVWTERSVGWERISGSWRQIPLGPLVGSVILLYVSYVARAQRIGAAFDGATEGRFGCRLRVVLLHTFSNNFFPVRSGELAFPVLMQQLFGIPMRVSLPRLLWFRALDAHFLLASAFVGIAIGHVPLWSIGIAVLLWSAAPLLAPYLRHPVAGWLSRRDGRGVRTLQRLVEGIPPDRTTVLRTEGWTAVNWAFKMAALAWLLLEIADLDVATALLGAVGGEASSVLPLHGVAGAGTYEAGVLAALTPLRVALEHALPAAVDLHLFILGACVVGAVPALVPWLWRRRAHAGHPEVDRHELSR